MEKKESHYKQGFFKPKNPKKYIGDPTNIVYRSGWEKKFMNYLDEHEPIIRWGSEEVVIPYISPVDNRPHRYFVDFYFEARAADGSIKKMLIEIKPYAQTQEPKIPKRRTKRFITEVMTYGVNQAKWRAAKDYCTNKGWEFQILTENEIFSGKKSK
jgi:hypothetical protein